MQSTSESASASKGALWAGRAVSALVVAFMIFDGVTKVVKAQASGRGYGSNRLPREYRLRDRSRLTGLHCASCDSEDLGARRHPANRLPWWRHRGQCACRQRGI